MARASAVAGLLLCVPFGSGCDEGTPMPSASSGCGTSCAYEPRSVVPPAGSPVEAHGALSVVSGQLVDQQGQALQLKGVSSMWLNWETTGYAENPSALQWLRDNWQVTVVRAAMGVDVQDGYLTDAVTSRGKVKRVVENAIELGMYVIIDWHDHGAEMHQAQSRAFFEQMASTYGEFPNVIYELYNEPLGVSWSGVLKPYHEGVLEGIRAIDPDNVAVLGTPNWSQQVLDAAMDPVTGDNLMYTLHFYACSHGDGLREDAEAAAMLGLPIFVTEWGATEADGGVANKNLCLAEAQAWHDWMNERQVSWSAWKLDGCSDGTCLFREGAPVSGPFSDDWLNGHGPFVRDRLLE